MWLDMLTTPCSGLGHPGLLWEEGWVGGGRRHTPATGDICGTPAMKNSAERVPSVIQVSRTLPGLSTATLSSLGGGMSRRNSGDTCTSVDTEASLREMRVSPLMRVCQFWPLPCLPALPSASLVPSFCAPSTLLPPQI